MKSPKRSSCMWKDPRCEAEFLGHRSTGVEARQLRFPDTFFANSDIGDTVTGKAFNISQFDLQGLNGGVPASKKTS